MIHLLHRLVVPRTPGGATVEGDRCALVHAEKNALTICRINPDLLRIVAAWRALEPGEAVATIGGLVARCAQDVDDVWIFRVNGNAAVVAALSVANTGVGGVHLPPVRAAVIGAIQPVVGHEEDALGVCPHGHGDGGAAREAGKAGSVELVPGEATIGGFVNRGARRSCRGGCRGGGTGSGLRCWRGRVVMTNRRCEDGVRRIVGARQFLHARLAVHKHHARPRLAAVVRAIDPAIFRLLMDISLRRHEHDVRVLQIHEHRGDLLGRNKSDVLPALAGVRRAVDAVPFVDHAAGDQVAGADVHDVRIRGCDLHGSDRGHALDVVENRCPGHPRACGFPDAAGRKAGVVDARLPSDTGNSRHASRSEGADVPPLKPCEKAWVDRYATRWSKGGHTEGEHGEGGDAERCTD